MSIENKNIDDLMRERFENFEVDPPAHVWENVKTGIATNKGGKPFLGNGIAGLSIILVSVGILSFLLLSNSYKLNNQITENSDTQELTNYLAVNTVSDYENAQLSSYESEASYAIAIDAEDSENENLTVSTNKEAAKKEKGTKKRGKRKNVVNFDAGVTNPVSQNKQGKSDLVVNRDETKISRLNSEKNSRVVMQNSPSGTFISMSDTYQSTSTVFQEKQKRSNDYFVKGTWNLGLYFTPEMIVYPSDNGLTNYSNTIEVNTSYQTNNLIFQTGIGVSQVTDKGNTKVDYHKYLGSYEDVYDVIVDSTGTNITYLTNTVNVYDSVQSEYISPTKRRFTYLQIPALFGYGKESRRFGWFIKGGPSVSFLIDQNIPENDMTYSSDMIINSENSLPGRIRTHWQFIMSAGATYKLGHRISLSVEPTFKYHLNSPYENSTLNTKYPYSIGLRTGLILNF